MVSLLSKEEWANTRREGTRDGEVYYDGGGVIGLGLAIFRQVFHQEMLPQSSRILVWIAYVGGGPNGR